MEKIEFVSTEIKLQAAAGELNQPNTKRVSILAYTGGLIRVNGWGLVVIDLAGLDISQPVKLLVDHEARFDRLLGQGKALIQNGQLWVEGVLIESQPLAQRIIELHKAGIALQASVGVQPEKVETLSAGQKIQINGRTIETQEPAKIIRQGKLKETSLVVLGADEQSQVSIAARAADLNNQTVNVNKRNIPMSLELETLKATLSKFDGILDQSDRDRLMVEAIEGGWTQDDLIGAATEKLRRKQQREQLHARSPRVCACPSPMTEQPAPAVLAAAMMLSTGRQTLAEKNYDERTLSQAAGLRATNALDLCKAALTLEGRYVPTDRNEMVQAAFSTNALRYALADAANKSIREGFEAAPATWREVGLTRPVSNFLKHRMISAIVRDGLYKEVADGGELKYVSLEDSQIEHSAKTKGVICAISRQTMINDQIGVVFDLQRTLGMNAQRTINKEFWGALKAAGSSYFNNANYGNYPTPGSSNTLSADAFGTAVAAIRAMKDATGDPIPQEPRVLVVPPALEAIARQIVYSSTVQIATGGKMITANVWNNAAKIVVEPLLGTAFGGNDTVWYLVGQREVCPAILVSFLNGVETPTVEVAEMQHDRLGLSIRAYLDFGVDLGDPRGIVKMATS